MNKRQAKIEALGLVVGNMLATQQDIEPFECDDLEDTKRVYQEHNRILESLERRLERLRDAT